MCPDVRHTIILPVSKPCLSGALLQKCPINCHETRQTYEKVCQKLNLKTFFFNLPISFCVILLTTWQKIRSHGKIKIKAGLKLEVFKIDLKDPASALKVKCEGIFTTRASKTEMTQSLLDLCSNVWCRNVSLGKQIHFRKPALSTPEVVPERKRSTPINPASTIRKCLSNNPVSQRPFRDRILHLLALKSYKKLEVLARLQRDGINQKDRNSLGTTLQQVLSVFRSFCPKIPCQL